jgi:hypothetical protein
MKLPPECGGGWGLLRRSPHDSRDAAACWESAERDFILSFGFRVGKTNISVLYHPAFEGCGPVRVVCHGHDLISVANDKALLA